ncbi:MAG TPA: hypothetical protein VMW53_12980, partial [archaeon]|nr:hypothetical protein [archaeon]
MKKLFLFLFVLAIAGTISLQAQGTTTIIVKADDNLVVVPPRAYDVVDTSAVSVVKIFDLTSKKAIQYYTIALDVDTTLHSAVLHKSIDIVLAESWNGTDYITKTTV